MFRRRNTYERTGELQSNICKEWDLFLVALLNPQPVLSPVLQEFSVGQLTASTRSSQWALTACSTASVHRPQESVRNKMWKYPGLVVIDTKPSFHGNKVAPKY